MIDCHFHSNFSFDSKSDPEALVEKAISSGLKVITFTDHLDYDADLLRRDFDFDIEDYFKTLSVLKERYKDRIEIFFGAELGIQPQLIKKYEDVARNYPWDFILMSIHTVEQRDLAIDGYVEKYSPVDGLIKYYETMLSMLNQFSDFDSLAHLDYLDRYYFRSQTLPEYEKYQEYVLEVFKKIIEMGKIIEINTAGIRKGLGYFHPKPPALSDYVKLGGTSATLGSDAHFVEDLGKDLTSALQSAKKIGIKTLSFFRKRKREDFFI